MTKPIAMIMFWSLGLIWGSSFIFMKLASELISPIQIVLLRVLFGALPVALYAWWHDHFRWSHTRHVGHLLVMAVIGTIGYYYGFAKGASLLHSGVAGALSGLTPILSLVIGLTLLSEERATRYRLLGIAIGFIGVVLIGNPLAADITKAGVEGVVYNLIGSLSVAASFVYAKRFIIPLGVPFGALITYQLALSGIILLLVADLSGINNIWMNTGAATGLILGLGVVGTGLAFILYYNIIRHLGAVSASTVAYIPPVVALIIGVVLVGEELALREYAGAVLILIGLALVSRRAHISA